MITLHTGVKKEIRGKLMTDEAWHVVYTASGMTQAKIITGRLETEGVPTRLKYEAAGAIYAITIDGLGEVRILVPAEDLDRTRGGSRSTEPTPLPELLRFSAAL